MPDYDKLPQPRLPEALENAIESINGVFDTPEQLLHADVRLFEDLNLCVFAYFGRDDVFYVNQSGRKILNIQFPAAEPQPVKAPPIFWLEDDKILISADRLVLNRRTPLASTRELVTLSWGKTWLEGIKFPILSVTGLPMALLFAGTVVAPSKQIRQVAEHYKLTQSGVGQN